MNMGMAKLLDMKVYGKSRSVGNAILHRPPVAGAAEAANGRGATGAITLHEALLRGFRRSYIHSFWRLSHLDFMCLSFEIIG